MNVLEPEMLIGAINNLLKVFEKEQSICKSEYQFYKRWLDLGRELFQHRIQSQIDAYESNQKNAHQKYSKRYHTRMGTIQLVRTSYRITNGYECLADKKLKLPESGWLPSIQKLACIFGIETDFENGVSILEETTQVKITGNTLANQVEGLGQKLVTENKAREPRETAPRDSALFKQVAKQLKMKPYVYVGMDGVMVSMNNKQGYKEALVGVVFWEQAHVKMSSKRKEIRHRHYVAMMKSKDEFVDELFKSYTLLVGENPCHTVILGDGAKWIWDRAEFYYPDAIQILDFYHLSEYVWKAAHEIYPKDKKKRQAWVKRRLKALQDSKWKNVLKVLEKYSHHNGETKTAVGNLATYLFNNRERVNYAKYLEMGLMIGSGVVESSNRRVVSQRLKRSGMHWSKKGANAIMALRAAYLSSDKQWQRFWQQQYAS